MINQNYDLNFQPARKIFLNQIKKLKNAENDSYFLPWKDINFLVRQIWCEGIVEDILEDGKIILNDCSGVKVEISTVDVPLPMLENLEKGKYLTVTGIIKKTEDMPRISAIKIHPCAETDADFKLWKLEVTDYWTFLVLNPGSY